MSQLPSNFKEFCDWCVLWIADASVSTGEPTFLLAVEGGIFHDTFPLGAAPASRFAAVTTLAAALEKHEPLYCAVVLPAAVSSGGAKLMSRDLSESARSKLGVIIAAFSKDEERILSCAEVAAGDWRELDGVEGTLLGLLRDVVGDWRRGLTLSRRAELQEGIGSPLVTRLVEEVCKATMPQGRCVVPCGRLIESGRDAVERLDERGRNEILETGDAYVQALRAGREGTLESEASPMTMATLVVIHLAMLRLEEMGIYSLMLDDPVAGQLAFLGPENPETVSAEEFRIVFDEAVAEVAAA